MEEPGDLPATFFELDGAELMERLGSRAPLEMAPASGGAAGIGSGFGGMGNGLGAPGGAAGVKGVNPFASRIMRQAASGLGDANDPYGGIGRHGAQKTTEAVGGRLLPSHQAYLFERGKIYNLLADDYITDHSDICKDEVACALLTAVQTT